MSLGSKLATALAGFFSFRVLMALITSTSVTAVVAGPMAYQASKARDEVVVAADPVGTTTTSEAPTLATVVPATTTTTTTTTTIAPVVTVPGQTTTTLPDLLPTGLSVSPNADHTLAVALQGSRLFGALYLFFDGAGVTSVTYWTDDPTGAGAPIAVASAPPFDVNPAMVDLTALGVGPHTLLAEVSTTSGTYRRLASFTVTG